MGNDTWLTRIFTETVKTTPHQQDARLVVLLPAAFGLFAAVAGLVALVARFRFNPLYAWLVHLHPRARQLQKARDLLDDGGRIRIAEHQDELETIHDVACEEYSNFSPQYTPVEFRWMHQAFEIRYAEQRTEGRKNTPGIREEILGHFNRRISRKLARVSAGATVVAIGGFAGLLLVSAV